MTVEEMRARALELFNLRFSWSQTLLTVGQEKLGRHNPELVRAMAAFGGGPARGGGVCGILSGAAALVASLYGRTTPHDKWDPRLYELNHKLGDKFAELTAPHGGVECCKIVGVDWRDEAQVRRFRHPADRRREVCIALVGDMAAYLGELLEGIAPPG